MKKLRRFIFLGILSCTIAVAALLIGQTQEKREKLPYPPPSEEPPILVEK